MSQSESNDPRGQEGLDAEVQRELNEALGDQNVEQLMEQATGPPAAAGPGETSDSSSNRTGQASSEGAEADASGPASPQETRSEPPEVHPQLRRGRIAAIRGEDVFVDLTGDQRMQGLVPLDQFDRSPRVGSIMDFVVDHEDESQGLVFLSREGAIRRATWEQLQRGAVVEARVLGSNKGGLELEIVGGIRAFMPASQIDTRHVEDLNSMHGQKLEGMVQQIERKARKVVLSRRQLLEHRQEQAKRKLLAELEPGQVRDGTVSRVMNFGAFVDLGGMDGLVHVSDLSYSHVDQPRDILQAGQSVRVKVLKVEPEKERIGLGLKQVQPDPWETVEGRYSAGEQVTGRVTRTADFGAFVELEPGVEGLLPASEMSWRRVNKPDEVVRQGDSVRLAVMQMEPARRRLTLSLKQARGDPWVGAEHKYQKESVHEGTVRSTTDFGAFIEVEPGVEGLVHISELSPNRVHKVEDVVETGQNHAFRVLETDEQNHKLRLSLKPAEEPEPETGTRPAGQPGEGGRRRSEKAARKPAKDLGGGMGRSSALGQGLGHLRLEDLK